MKKKTLIMAIAAALVLALLLGGLPLFSRLYYGRSQAATLFAWQLHKERYTTDEAFAAYLAEKRAENAEDYMIPEDTDAHTGFVRAEYAGLTFFVTNGAGSPDQRVILYFPGGSFIDQPRAVHWDFLARLAADTDAMVAVPIYPKLPDSDAKTAYAALADAYTEFMRGMLHGEVVFMGDSAGGGMALSFAMQLRDAGLAGPDKLVLICPWVDVTMENPDIPAYEKKDTALDSAMLAHLGALWAGGLDPKDPAVSPLYGTFDGLGDITLLTGTCELLYPDIMRLSGRLADAGVGHQVINMRGMFHVWPLYVGYNIPEASEAYELIVSAVTA